MKLNHQSEYNQAIADWLKRNREFAKFLATQKLDYRNCPVCSSEDFEFYANNDYLDFTKCRKCNLVFLNPVFDLNSVNDGFKGNDTLLKDYFNIISKYRPHNPDKIPDAMYDLRIQAIKKIISDGLLLDVGCGDGNFLHIASQVYEVEGVEVNPQTADIASNFFTIHRDYLENLNLKPRYDVVTLNQILYGVPDPVSLFSEIYKVLKPGGILYINTPNSDSYAMDLFKGKANHITGYTTLNVFNQKSLTVLANDTNFIIEKYHTEWLDIYLPDIMIYLTDRESFIHKRNVSFPEYERLIKLEDNLHKEENFNLGDKGNYLVAVLRKPK